MFGSIFNDLQKFINDLCKLVFLFTEALHVASAWRSRVDVAENHEPGIAHVEVA